MHVSEIDRCFDEIGLENLYLCWYTNITNRSFKFNTQFSIISPKKKLFVAPSATELNIPFKEKIWHTKRATTFGGDNSYSMYW